MKRITNARNNLDFGRRVCAVLALCAATAITSPAQNVFSPVTTLMNFDVTNGANPSASLIQATNGDFYGTTTGGGAFGNGTVFQITAAGNLTTLYSFCAQANCADGSSPWAGLVQARNGDFYGVTAVGGASNLGTVFQITAGGKLTTLHSFDGTDGSDPQGGLTQAANGYLYGTTISGGSDNYGTVFKITTTGKLTTLHSFSFTDGANPVGRLVQATNGSLYGTTVNGGPGPNNAGTIFKITPSGTLTTLYDFCAQADCADGSGPFAGLVQAANGNLYGTTSGGGANMIVPSCTKSGGAGWGTVFEITPAGELTTLHTFQGTDGGVPYAGLVQATDGNFYGTTVCDGEFNDGTVFVITAGGLTTKWNFAGSNGANLFAGLVQGTDGTLYGATFAGGTDSACETFYSGVGCGTVFSLYVGLGPFVETQPTLGKVGAAVKILGTDLTGATSVSFNGTAAVFKVVSSSLITTTVPAGATTGKVTVVTPSATLSSNVAFRVLP